MRINYLCPHCKGNIALNNEVVFSVKAPDDKVGLISLHSELGNYAINRNPEFKFNEGDYLDFYCPICHTELASDIHKTLAKVIMIDDVGNEFEILFSQKVGEKTTYKIVGETMEIYGDDSAEYLDFINLSMNY